MSETEETSREQRLERMRQCIAWGEDEYDQIYEPRTHHSPAGHYSDAKEFFGEAIRLARSLGLEEKAGELTKRLEHIKTVYRGQFSGLG